MNKKLLEEIVVICILVLLFALFIDPYMLIIPNTILMIVISSLVVMFTIFAVYLWREQPRDERESLHRIIANRIAFLAGSGMLVIGIILKTLKHQDVQWLVVTLAVMILGKVFGSMWARWKK